LILREIRQYRDRDAKADQVDDDHSKQNKYGISVGLGAHGLAGFEWTSIVMRPLECREAANRANPGGPNGRCRGEPG
jgi:hypothetical protein